MTATTRELATFLAGLSYENLPAEVIERAEELFIDWAASALAGKGTRPVSVLERFAETMGPAGGPSEVLVSRVRTSPLFAALVNAASHVVGAGRSRLAAAGCLGAPPACRNRLGEEP